MNIYVSNLSFSVGDDALQNLFSAFGEVSSAKVIMDRETGRSRGFGFVEMPDDASANAAMSALQGKSVDGRNINVSEARPKTKNRNWI